MQVQKSHKVSLIYLMKGVLSMNKNEQTATMYESIPAVAELNKVPGFNPLKLLRRIISPENGEEMLQLDLRYKKLWFRLANPKGRIRLNALRITEQMAIYEAQVFLERTDENPIGSFTSSCTKEEAPGGQYIQAAQHAAMDEALSDAGFGIQFADVGMDAKGSRYGSRVPLNGVSQNKGVIPAAGKESTGGEQQAAPARSTVTAFPAAAEKKETPQQEKPAQTSGLPIQGAKAAVNAGPAGNSPAPRRRWKGSLCLPHRNRQDSPLQDQRRPWKQVEKIKRNRPRSRLKTAVCQWDRRQQRFRERRSLPEPGNCQ